MGILHCFYFGIYPIADDSIFRKKRASVVLQNEAKLKPEKAKIFSNYTFVCSILCGALVYGGVAIGSVILSV